MKNQILFLPIAIISLLLLFPSLNAQEDEKQKKGKNYIFWVKQMNTKPIKGYLSDIGENDITIFNNTTKESHYIQLNNINAIHYRKEGNSSTGYLVGGIVGTTIGGLLGYYSNKNELYPGLSAVVGGVVGCLPGAAVGGLIGSAKIEIPIEGNWKNQKTKLTKYKVQY